MACRRSSMPWKTVCSSAGHWHVCADTRKSDMSQPASGSNVQQCRCVHTYAAAPYWLLANIENNAPVVINAWRQKHTHQAVLIHAMMGGATALASHAFLRSSQLVVSKICEDSVALSFELTVMQTTPFACNSMLQPGMLIRYMPSQCSMLL
jgi:hypothetical protein